MTDSIVFVLHGGADQPYATQLAAALAPAPAIPARLAADGAPGVRFGSGGVCLVIWSRALAADNGAAAVLDALAHARGNAALCRLGGAPPPESLAHLPSAPVSGDAGADLAVVRGVLARIEQALAARDAAAAQPALAGPVGQLKSKQHLAVRSATGVAATFAVVGMVAPPIAERAQAVGPEPAAQPAAPGAAEPVAFIEPDVQVVATAATSSTPLLDEWLPAEPAPPATMLAAAIEPVALSVAHPEPGIAESSLLDPKRAAWEADRSSKDAPVAEEAKARPHAAASATSKDG